MNPRFNINQAELIRFQNMMIQQKHLLNKDVKDILFQHGRLLARDLFKYTPPSGGKKEGENAVARDINRTMKPFYVKELSDQKLSNQINKLVRSRDYEGMRSIMENIPEFKRSEFVPFDDKFHKKERLHRDGLHVWRDSKRFTLDKKDLKDYVKSIIGRVGKLKASWLALAEFTGLTAIPAWITRHSLYGKSVGSCTYTEDHGPTLVITNNSKPYTYIVKVMNDVLHLRANAMERDIENKIRILQNRKVS